MNGKASLSTIREAVGVFDDVKSYQAAIDELLTSGFDHADISLLAGAETVEEKLGHAYTKVSELEDDADVPRVAYASTEALGDAEGGLIGGLTFIGAVAATGALVASGGALIPVVIGAAAAGGVGAAVGSVLAGVLGRNHAEHIQKQLDHGGLLLWVRTWDAKREEKAVAILSKHSAHDVHVHELPG